MNRKFNYRKYDFVRGISYSFLFDIIRNQTTHLEACENYNKKVIGHKYVAELPHYVLDELWTKYFMTINLINMFMVEWCHEYTDGKILGSQSLEALQRDPNTILNSWFAWKNTEGQKKW